MPTSVQDPPAEALPQRVANDGPSRARPSSGRLSGTASVRHVCGALFASGSALLAVTLMTLRTDSAEIYLVAEDPNVEVTVSRGGEVVTILDAETNRRAVLDPDTYTLTLTDGEETSQIDLPDAYTLRRGETRILRITRVPRENAIRRNSENLVREIRWPAAHLYFTGFSPGGGTYFACGDPNIVRLWDVETGRQLRKLVGHEGYIQSAAFSPDGRQFASGGWQDKVVILWDLATGEVVRRFQGHSAGVISVAFSPDGRVLLTGSDDSTLRLWDVATGRALHTLRGHSDPVRGYFSPDGKQVLSCGNDQTVRLWDFETGDMLRLFDGHAAAVHGAVFLKEPGRFATYSEDRTVRVWDAGTGEEVRRLMLDRDLASHGGAVAFDLENGRLLSVQTDRSLKLIDLETGKTLRRFESEIPARGLSFSPDGRLAATGSYRGTVYLWDVAPRDRETKPADSADEAE